MTTRQEKIGNALLSGAEQQRLAHPDRPLSRVADKLQEEGVFDALGSDMEETLGVEQQRRYQAELRERALSGDRYAKSMLSGAAYDEPGDD